MSVRERAVKTAKIITSDKVSGGRHRSAAMPEPITNDWAWLEAVIGPLDDDFVAAVAEQPDEHPTSR